jgi:hypothetical protein
MPRGVARSGVVGRVELRNGLLAFSRGALEQRKAQAQEAALTSALIGKNTGQNIIATVPSSLRPGKVGRIWTGAMWEDFDADVTQTGNRIRIRLGWIKKKRTYYRVQEYGGTAFGVNIVPMHALAGALIAAENHLKDKGIK